jgi:hypothetical protein
LLLRPISTREEVRELDTGMCPPREVGLVRDEQPSGAVLAQMPAVAVWAAVKLLAADIVHCELLGAGINSCSCGWFGEAAHSILMSHRIAEKV